MRSSLRQVLFRSTAGLDLNFAGGVFSLNTTRTASLAAIPGWSFSRTDTNGTATALDLAGNVIQFATGTPRITNRGILVEEARTNRIFPSIPNAATGGSNNWSRNWAGNNSTIVLNDRVAPDGTTTATRVTTTGIGEGVFYRTTTLPAANADWTAATYVYSVAGFTAGVIISHSGGTAWTNVTQSNVVVPAGVWTRIPLTRTAAASVTATSTTFAVTAPASGETFWVWSCDFGPGAFATSPIITTGAAGTRGADSPLLTGLGGPLTPPFTLYTEGDTGASRWPVFAAVDDGSAANRMQQYRTGSTNTNYALIDSGGGSAGADVGTVGGVVAGQTTRHASSVTSAGLRACRDGGSVVAVVRAVNPMNRLLVGQSVADGTNAANGYIRRIRILPYAALTDAQLQALTAP